MTTTNDGTPIACTLGGAAYGERVAWIAQLNHDGLRGHRRHAASLELDYDARVRDRVYELVRREAECCAFLDFVIEELPNQVRVTITVSERAAGMSDELLAPFVGDERPCDRGSPRAADV